MTYLSRQLKSPAG